MELRRMRSFISFQPGEVRGCVGCHESRPAAPTAAPTPLAALREAIEAIVGPLAAAAEDAPAAPGTLASHYAPRADVIAVEPAEVPAVNEASVAGEWIAPPSVVLERDRPPPGLP